MTATLTDGEALLAGVLADPDDDLPRLAMADWLEENGEADRAEFVRVQVAFAALVGGQGPPAEGMMFPDDWPEEAKRLCLRSLWLYSMLPDMEVRLLHGPALWCYRPSLGNFRRGFLESVELPLQAWLDHGPALVRAHPVREARLTDRDPGESEDEPASGWYRKPSGPPRPDEEDELPPFLWDLLDGAVEGESPDRWRWYASRQDGMKALSRACVAWANLPEGER